MSCCGRDGQRRAGKGVGYGCPRYSGSRAGDGVQVRLYWRHVLQEGPGYYVVYRTSSKDVADAKIWRQFEHPIKVPGDSAGRPLTVEFGLVDVSAQPDGRQAEPLGIFRRTDYDPVAGGNGVTFANLVDAGLENFQDGTQNAQLGRFPVQKLAGGEPVVCYYRDSDGTEQPPLIELASEKTTVDLVADGSTYYYTITSVDAEINLADLADAMEVDLTRAL